MGGGGRANEPHLMVLKILRIRWSLRIRYGDVKKTRCLRNIKFAIAERCLEQVKLPI